MASLSIALKNSYRITCNLSESMLSKIDLNCLELNDSDLSQDDVSPLCSFLLSKEATCSIETLILKSKRAHDKNSSFLKDEVTSYLNGSCKETDYPGKSTAFTGKLMNAIVVFISKSLNLHSVIIDSVRMQTDFLCGIGEALSTSKSVVRWLSFKSCPLGNSGLKILRPHIGKMQLQVLVFEKCGLSDESCSYLSSIIKSQEAMLDTLFWNTTLRSDPLSISGTAAAKRTQETNRVLSSGLVAISVNGNNITKNGVDIIRQAISNNHWFLGLNIANNLIDHEGVSMLVRSIKDNNALHALLLGGNPGFSAEAAQCVNDTTSKAPLRLSLMPKGVAMLLRRWMQLQATEMVGGTPSANTSVSGLGPRIVPETYRQPGIVSTDLNSKQHNNDSLRCNDVSEYDPDNSRISHQPPGMDLWAKSNGGKNFIVDDNFNGNQVPTSSADVAWRENTSDLNIGRPPMSREAWRENIPKGEGMNSFKIYLNPQSQTPLSAFLPMSTTPSQSHRPQSLDLSTFSVDAMNIQQPYDARSYTDDREDLDAILHPQWTPNSHSRTKNPTQGHTGGGSRPTNSGPSIPVPSDWASSSAKGTLDEQLRNLVSTSLGRQSTEYVPKVNARRAPRSPSPSWMARRQANICARMSQGIASTERYIPPIRARQSPHRRYSHEEGSERDVFRESASMGTMREMRERYGKSPSRVYNSNPVSQKGTPHVIPSPSPYQEATPRPRSEGSGKKKKKKSKKCIQESKQATLEQQALQGVISSFSNSVREINRSLGTVSDQLRDVSGSLTASIGDRVRSSSDNGHAIHLNETPVHGSPVQLNGASVLKDGSPVTGYGSSVPGTTSSVNIPASNPFKKIEISPAKAEISLARPDITPSRKPISPSSASGGYDSTTLIGTENGATNGHLRGNMAQTFGRSRGSLMHRSGTWSGGNLLDLDNENQNHDGAVQPSTPSLLSSFMSNQKPKAPSHHAQPGIPVHKTTDINKHSNGHHPIHVPNAVSNSHDRWSARILSASSAVSDKQPSVRGGDSRTDFPGNKVQPPSESVEMSESEIATLILDRLRKKLKSVLRPPTASAVSSPSP